MPYSLDDKMVVAVSSRALFNLDAENDVYEREGSQAFREYELARLKEAAQPGVAFSLVKKLLRFNTPGHRCVEVVLLSRNDPVSGLRAFHSTAEHGLDITRGAFTGGAPPFPYLKPFRAVLFLSANPADVQAALEVGCPAATVYSGPPRSSDLSPDELRIAFDGDAVLFSDASEQIYQAEGIERFHEHESQNADQPLPPGPFRRFIEALHGLQRNPPAGTDLRIHTALVTARNAPSHERAILTLMNWQIDVDEAYFLGGAEKKEFLEAFHPDFFFDDQKVHCDPASKVVNTAHVPAGVANQKVLVLDTSEGLGTATDPPTNGKRAARNGRRGRGAALQDDIPRLSPEEGDAGLS
jgi:5'-nucleotidase